MNEPTLRSPDRASASAVGSIGAGKSAQRPGLSPIDMVAFAIGSDRIPLRGFAPPPTMPSWTHPGTMFVPATLTDAELGEATAAHKRRLWTIRFCSLVLSHAAIALGAVWLTTELAHKELPGGPGAYAAAPGSFPGIRWQVTAIKDGFVSVRLGEQADSAVVTFPNGARLPSGERLITTVPARNAYVTDAGTTILRSTP